MPLQEDDPVMKQPFYYGILPRQDTLDVLLEEGEFLVRKASVKTVDFPGWCISIRWNKQVYHVLVRRTRHGYVLENHEFLNVDELVKFYLKHSIPLTAKSQAVLRRPVSHAKWVLHESQVKMLDKLGEGNFGEVWKGILTTPEEGQEMVAIKLLKSIRRTSAEYTSFFDECRRLRMLKHKHLVNFRGALFDKDPIRIVMELCDCTLVDYLRNNKGKFNRKEKVYLCLQAAYGMEYLAAESFIHRDLAARNCLLKQGTLKISDLGMARQGSQYVLESGVKQIPLKWTAPEALRTHIYTEKTDVWSFGVLMWEIFSEGEPPYAEMQQQSGRVFPEVLIRFIVKGGRLTPPYSTPKPLKDLMVSCWNGNPSKRMFFTEIRQTLEKVYGEYELARPA